MHWHRATLISFLLALPFWGQSVGPIILIIGPPGSGKTTQTQMLQKEFGFAVVSADELIAANQQEFAKAKNPNIQGVERRLDPAMNRLVEEKLRSIDLSKGVILDGYPAAKDHGDHLTALAKKLQLPKPIIIHLKVPDDVVRKRLKNETANNLEQFLKDYHREFDFARVYFPEADIHDIDGTKKPKAVFKQIKKILKGT